MTNMTEEQKWRIGALIDKHLFLKIGFKGKLSGWFSSRRYEPIKFLSDIFGGTICPLGKNYGLVFSGGKVLEISKLFSDYCPIMKNKLVFCADYFLNKPKYNEVNLKELNEYKNNKKKEFSTITDGLLSGAEPEEYTLEFLDDIDLFNFTKSKDRYGKDKTLLYFSKSSIYETVIKNYEVVLNKKAVGYIGGLAVRLNKEESHELAKKIKDRSLTPYFYKLYMEGCESLKDLRIYEEIKAIKETKINISLLTSKTAKQKKEESIAIKRDRKAALEKAKEDEKRKKLETILEKRRIRKEAMQKNKLEKQNAIQKERELANIERRKTKEEKRAARIERDTLDTLKGTKRCKKCKKDLPIMAYTVTSHGIMPTCKQCYYEEYKEKAKIRMKDYQRKNRAKIRVYEKNRRSLPIERMRASMKNRLKSLFFRKGDARTAEILGMSLSDFKLRIQSQFKPGMSWDNYGSVWDVDHIIPCRAFDHSIREHVLLCWNHKNLRPEFRSENYSKHDKMVNGLSARAMMENDPDLLFKVRNQMLRQIGLPEIQKEDKTEQMPEETIRLNIF